MLQFVFQFSRHEAFKETVRHYAAYKIVKIQPLKRPNEEIPDISHENQELALKYAVAPLWDIPYPEQLEMKDQWISYVVSQYFDIMRNHFSKKPQPLPPRPNVKSICPSPVVHHYRLKDKYMVRPGLDGNPKTVGHIVGRPSQGKYICVPPVDILSPPDHVEVAKAFQHYVRSSSLPACQNFSEGGNWTEIQVRSNSSGEKMALVKFHPQQLTQLEIDNECSKLKEYFANGPGSACHLSSLYFQSSPYSNASAKIAPYQLLLGNKYLMEKLSGRDFAISPGSFFQCNLKMAEIMYDKVLTAADVCPSTSILDLGCGIGTLSILASPFVRGVVGIDMSEEAIHDAKYNASLNNIFSANFISGLMGKKIKSALKLVEPSSDIVAILNPGRCGVESSLIHALREMPQIGKVIYVSCQPDHEWVIRNVLGLIKPEGPKFKGRAFTFKSVIPVDMFPLTVQCELIMKFER